MVKAIAIIVSAVLFSLIGVGCGVAGLAFGEPTRGDERLFLTFAPPLAGGVFGLVVGCVAVALGTKLSSNGSHRQGDVPSKPA